MFIVVDKFEILNVYLFCFETDWRYRSEKLQQAKGFVNFELMRGKCSGIFTAYNCQTKWVSQKHFLDWLNSDNFLQIREETPSNYTFHYSPPEHECYELVM